MKFNTLPGLLLAAVLVTTACSKRTAPSSAAATAYPAPSASAYLPADSAARAQVLATPGGTINLEREQLVSQIDGKMNELNTRIDDLEKQERDLSRQRRDLEKQRRRLGKQAKDLKKYDATAEWQRKKEEVNKTLN